MDDYAQEIQRKMDALPPDVRNFIYSADMGNIIRSIGAKHQLHVDQIGALESEAAAVMIGLSDAKNFTNEVADTLRVSQEQAVAIVSDVNSQLFVKIQDAMRGKPVAPAVAPAPAAVPPISVPLPKPPTASPAQASGVPTPPKPPVTPPPAAAAPAPTPVTPPAQKPKELHPADLMLSQKQVTVAPPPKLAPAPATPAGAPQNAQKPATPPAPSAPAAPQPPAPKPYAADPYREPI